MFGEAEGVVRDVSSRYGGLRYYTPERFGIFILVAL